MTTTQPYKARHAAPDTSAAAVQSIDGPTQVLPVVIPAQHTSGSHAPATRRSGVGLWAFLIAVVALVGVIVAIGLAEPSLANNGGPAEAATPVETPQQQMAAWSSGGGLSRTETITAALQAGGDAASRYDVSGLANACRDLQRGVESAQAYAPIPDAQAQTSWSSALTNGSLAAGYCITGTQSSNAPLIELSAARLNAMTDDLNRTTDRMNTINGID